MAEVASHLLFSMSWALNLPPALLRLLRCGALGGFSAVNASGVAAVYLDAGDLDGRNLN